jgi:hypothetical protein
MDCNKSYIGMGCVSVSVRRREAVSAIVSRVCTVDEVTAFIRFDPGSLYWNNSEVGVTKYTKLITNRKWELGELIIEELL